MKSIVVFRRDLFKVSEQFIVDQASAHRYVVVYVGDALHGEPPPGSITIVGRWKRRRRVSHHRPDLVHCHFLVDLFPAWVLAKNLGVPLVVTAHGFDATKTRSACLRSGRPNLMMFGLFRPWLLRLPNRILAVSGFIRDKLIDTGVDPSRVLVHHIGIPLPTPITSPSGRDASYQALPRRAGSQGFVIIHVARLVAKKGTTYLIDAIAILRANGIDVSLIIVGDGPLRKSLLRQTLDHHLTESVEFRGALPHSEVLQLLGACDALCLPSIVAPDGDAEGLGMVLLEAAAIGVPVVATRTGGIPDFVTDEVSGLLVDAGDASALARALGRLSEDRGFALMLAERAYAELLSGYDVQTQTSRLEHLFADSTSPQTTGIDSEIFLVACRSIPAHGQPGGMELAGWALTTYLAETRNVVCVTTSVPGRPRVFEIDSVKVIAVRARAGRYSVKWWVHSAIVSWRLQPDVVIGIGGGATSVVLIGRAARKIVQAHGTSLREATAAVRNATARDLARAIRMAMWVLIDTFVFAKVDAVIPVSEKVHGDLSSFPYRAALGKRLCPPINNGIPVDRFKSALQRRVSLRREVVPTASHADVVVLFLGRVTRQKGLDLLVRALADDSDDRFRLLVAGEGDHLEEVRKLIDRLDLTNKVTVLGAVSHDRVADLVALSDIMAFVARTPEREGLPLSVLEGLAGGLQVVSPAKMIWPQDLKEQIATYKGEAPSAVLEALRVASGRVEAQRGNRLPSQYNLEMTLAEYVTRIDQTQAGSTSWGSKK